MSKLKSENIVISSPLSFIGSAKRIWKITDVDNPVMKVLLSLVVAALILFAWVFVAFWYVLIYVIFGILFVPYRLLRRSSRKQKQAKLRHREVLEAIEKNRNL
jgi:Flp pilus assembly protein TadB